MFMFDLDTLSARMDFLHLSKECFNIIGILDCL